MSIISRLSDSKQFDTGEENCLGIAISNLLQSTEVSDEGMYKKWLALI